MRARGIINSGNFRDFKSGQKNTNRGRDFKSGKEISNRGSSDFKLGQGLQIDAEQHHSLYYIAHHPNVSSNITNAIHFSTPPTPYTLAHQPPYPRWFITNGLSPIIMSEVFNFQNNVRYNLRSGIHVARRNMNTAHFGTDTISGLGPKL